MAKIFVFFLAFWRNVLFLCQKIYTKLLLRDMEKQKKTEKTMRISGMVRNITRKTGYTEHYVSRVLNGKVPARGPKARAIMEMADRIAKKMEEI